MWYRYAVGFFVRLPKFTAGILTYFKVNLGDMTGNPQVDVPQSPRRSLCGVAFTKGVKNLKGVKIYASVLLALALCSCSGGADSEDNGIGLAVVDNGGASYNTNVPAYSYPEFLSKVSDKDSYSNVSYKSFDSALVSEVKTQPFEGYECITSYPGLYIFKAGNFVGVIDSDGNVVLPADTFARAEFVSPTLLKMYLYDFDDSDYVYADISSRAEPRLIDNYNFKSSNIKTVERKQEDSDRVLIYLEANGFTVGQQGYDSVLQKDVSELPADIDCKKAYTVTKDGAYYVIAFDRYYNYIVYEGTYAKVDLNLAGKPGSCYIMSYEDDLEAKTLIDSFKRSDDDNSSTEGDDYISIDFGLYGDDDYLVTIYSSGRLISQGVRGGSQIYESAKVDKRCFGDLVRWVDTVVSREYDIKEEAD